MNFLNIKLIYLLNAFILLLNVKFIRLSQAQFVHSIVTLTSPTQTFTIPYNKTLPVGNYYFAYFLQSGELLRSQFRLTHNPNTTTITSTQCTIQFVLNGVASINPAAQVLNVRLLISAYPRSLIAIEMVTTTPSTATYVQLPVKYDAVALVVDLEAKVFTLNIPMSFTQSLFNSTHLKILPTKTPAQIANISFSYIILTRNFLSYNVAMFFDKIKISNLGWIILFNNDTFFDPSQSTMLVGLNSYLSNAPNVINNQIYVDYNFAYPSDPPQRAVYVNYDIDGGSPSQLNATIFIFSEIFNGCANGGFLTYTELYYDSPLSCQACHITCLTCTSVNYSLALTDQYSCMSCGNYKYLDKVNQNATSGQCKCYTGLNVDPITQECFPCATDCLGYNVHFMKMSTKSQFIMMFSSKINSLVPIQNNLQVFINQNSTPASFVIMQKKQGLYSIFVDLKALQVCITVCQVNFTFKTPHKILKANKNQALAQYQQIVQIQDFYNPGDRIPQQLDQAFAISGMMVGAAAGGGLSSLLKMLFQLEQMIQYHKYLNLELPVVFKEFIQSLGMFRFLDITTVFPFDIDNIMQGMGPDQFDMEGPIKSIYYDYGSNFYKNIMPIIISFGIIMLINIFLFLILRIIPCQLFWRFSQKLRVRALITLSDMIQTMVLPIVVFSQFQIFTVYFKLRFMWVYVLMCFLFFMVLFLPFFIMTHVYMNKRSKIMKDVYQDLLYDCQNEYNATYIFYVVSYYRKILFAFSLTYFIPGKVQGPLIIAINVIYLSMIIYVIFRRIFNSKIKILTKTINSICILGIEIIMIYYNAQKHSIDRMLDLGVTCVYLAIIATAAGIIEAVIKIFEIIFQNVYMDKKLQKNRQVDQIQQIAKELGIQNPLKSPKFKKDNKQLDHILVQIDSKESIDTADADLRQNKRKIKRSLFDKPKRGLSYLSSLITGKNKNQRYEQNENSKDKSNEQSFGKMIAAEQLVSIDSNDDLGISVRKNQNQKIKIKRDNESLGGKFKNKTRKFNTLEVITSDVIKKPTFPQSQDLYQIPQLPRNVDDQIQQIQNRIRQKMNIKKKTSLPSQNIKRNKKDPIINLQTQQQYPAASQLRRVTRSNKQKPSKQPETQRVRYEQYDDGSAQNINQKKTARRKNTKQSSNNKNSPNKEQKKSNKKQDDDEEDIYYVK